ncbi:MAG TPA: Imm10 family immunity protein [Candidatus Limnocylindrales bacterium]|jgi:hypothetical protein|nr:Imm10 family immunity protein [Candidatus Limnocylindrales bacterium]
MVMNATGVDRSDGDLVVAGIAEHEDGSGAALIFQGRVEPSMRGGSEDSFIGRQLQDFSLSNHLGATVYGGVEAWTLQGSRLNLRFGEDAVRTLHAKPSMMFELRVNESQLADLRVALEQILGPSQAASS